jgi:hypothetical protein
MNELKTLKDLDFWNRIQDEDYKMYYDDEIKRQLRQEAIKWIKEDYEIMTKES